MIVPLPYSPNRRRFFFSPQTAGTPEALQIFGPESHTVKRLEKIIFYVVAGSGLVRCLFQFPKANEFNDLPLSAPWPAGPNYRTQGFNTGAAAAVPIGGLEVPLIATNYDQVKVVCIGAAYDDRLPFSFVTADLTARVIVELILSGEG